MSMSEAALGAVHAYERSYPVSSCPMHKIDLYVRGAVLMQFSPWPIQPKLHQSHRRDCAAHHAVSHSKSCLFTGLQLHGGSVRHQSHHCWRCWKHRSAKLTAAVCAQKSLAKLRLSYLQYCQLCCLDIHSLTSFLELVPFNDTGLPCRGAIIPG